MSACFELEIVSQGWLDVPNAEHDDLCSHGDLRLVIGGTVVAAGDGSGDYTISTSALALLRTLESDHSTRAPVVPTALVMHCGMLSMVSCPEGIDWSVSHRDGRVLLADVVKNETERFPGLAVDLSEDEYRRAVVAFAEKAKEPFATVEKTLDDSTRDEYEAFWREYDERLGRAARG
jgi:hypothetical protein